MDRIGERLDLCKLDVSSVRIEIQMGVCNDVDLIFFPYRLERQDQTAVPFLVHSIDRILPACLVLFNLIVEGNAELLQKLISYWVIVGRRPIDSGLFRLLVFPALVPLTLQKRMNL